MKLPKIPTKDNGWDGMGRVIERSSRSKSKQLACSSAVIVTVGGKQYRYHQGLYGDNPHLGEFVDASAVEVKDQQHLPK